MRCWLLEGLVHAVKVEALCILPTFTVSCELQGVKIASNEASKKWYRNFLGLEMLGKKVKRLFSDGHCSGCSPDCSLEEFIGDLTELVSTMAPIGTSSLSYVDPLKQG